MNASATANQPDIRARILDDPSMILDDPEVMRALLRADQRVAGRNVVDLRGALVDRLEERLDRLEDTHREVLAAAYDNVAGTNQVHRACLSLLDARDFAGFLQAMTGPVANTLGVDVIRLALEAPSARPGQPLGPAGGLAETVVALAGGGAERYLTEGRRLGARPVTLRRRSRSAPEIYGAAADLVRSEAVLRLDLGPGRLGALLSLGSFDPGRFHPDQGTDLLAFLAGLFERCLRRWLE